MPENRPPIPANLKRQVLVEAGHRCAIPTCRHISVEIHHIIPWEQCQSHGYDNLIALCPNCHERADRGKIDRKSLLMYKANLRYAHDRFSQFEVDFLFEIAKTGYARWPEALIILVRRLLDAGLIVQHKPENEIMFYQGVGGFNFRPIHLRLSTKGEAFIAAIKARTIDETEIGKGES
jgi:hypothetical protein